MNPEPILETVVDLLPVSVYRTDEEMGTAAADAAAATITEAVGERGEAGVVFATGNSQLTFMAALRQITGIPWSRVRVFHMDEYVNLAPGHPASFPAFLKRHLLRHIRPAAFHPLSAPAGDLEAACEAYAGLLRKAPVDLCAMGIGENGHIAFNDPPYADFNDPRWVKVVELDEVSRRQQVGEGHFAALEEVPTHALTLTIPALLAARRILCIVPEVRKAAAVTRALTGPVEDECPASILRRQEHAHLYLDAEAAARVFPDLGRPRL